MFELAVATLRANEIPTIVFKQPEEVTPFTFAFIRAFSDRWKPHNR
jgi:hypothetical protein